MICPNCSNKIEDGSVFCSECGADLRKKDKRKSLVYKNLKVEDDSKMSNGAKIAIILAIIGCIMCFGAASEISTVSNEMITLRSESGTSLAEVYYQDIGKALNGLAVFCRAFGVSSLAITIAVAFRKSR